MWNQGQAVTHDPEEIRQVHKDWENTEPQKTIKSEGNTKTKTVKMPTVYNTGDQVGYLDIPRIGNQYDIFWGTGEDTLKKGVGLHESRWTVAPGESGHVVLSGHRDTVFRKLKQVQQGDHLYVNFEGTTYDYQVRDIWITDEDDRSVIVRKNKPTLTLTTCYPFDYLGSAPQRYIIQAELVATE